MTIYNVLVFLKINIELIRFGILTCVSMEWFECVSR